MSLNWFGLSLSADDLLLLAYLLAASLFILFVTFIVFAIMAYKLVSSLLQADIAARKPRQALPDGAETSSVATSAGQVPPERAQTTPQ